MLSFFVVVPILKFIAKLRFPLVSVFQYLKLCFLRIFFVEGVVRLIYNPSSKGLISGRNVQSIHIDMRFLLHVLQCICRPFFCIVKITYLIKTKRAFFRPPLQIFMASLLSSMLFSPTCLKSLHYIRKISPTVQAYQNLFAHVFLC